MPWSGSRRRAASTRRASGPCWRRCPTGRASCVCHPGAGDGAIASAYRLGIPLGRGGGGPDGAGDPGDAPGRGHPAHRVPRPVRPPALWRAGPALAIGAAAAALLVAPALRLPGHRGAARVADGFVPGRWDARFVVARGPGRPAAAGGAAPGDAPSLGPGRGERPDRGRRDDGGLDRAGDAGRGRRPARRTRGPRRGRHRPPARGGRWRGSAGRRGPGSSRSWRRRWPRARSPPPAGRGGPSRPRWRSRPRRRPPSFAAGWVAWRWPSASTVWRPSSRSRCWPAPPCSRACSPAAASPRRRRRRGSPSSSAWSPWPRAWPRSSCCPSPWSSATPPRTTTSAGASPRRWPRCAARGTWPMPPTTLRPYGGLALTGLLYGALLLVRDALTTIYVAHAAGHGGGGGLPRPRGGADRRPPARGRHRRARSPLSHLPGHLRDRPAGAGDPAALDARLRPARARARGRQPPPVRGGRAGLRRRPRPPSAGPLVPARGPGPGRARGRSGAPAALRRARGRPPLPAASCPWRWRPRRARRGRGRPRTCSTSATGSGPTRRACPWASGSSSTPTDGRGRMRIDETRYARGLLSAEAEGRVARRPRTGGLHRALRRARTRARRCARCCATCTGCSMCRTIPFAATGSCRSTRRYGGTARSWSSSSWPSRWRSPAGPRRCSCPWPSWPRRTRSTTCSTSTRCPATPFLILGAALAIERLAFSEPRRGWFVLALGVAALGLALVPAIWPCAACPCPPRSPSRRS